jgi:hypothetical protein
MSHHETLWLWVPACAGTTSVVGAISAKTSRLYSAALAVLPNIRVGVAKPQVVPSVILT